MGLFDGSGDSSGLMGMYANPQTAALLGMSQGLLSAAGPSRIPVSMGQAMGAGMQGMQQNAGNALQMQQQLLRMRAMQGLMGDQGGQGQQQPQQPQQPGQPDPTMAQGAPVAGGANTGAMSGPSAGMGLMAPQMPQQQPAQAAPQASGGIYGKTPQQLFQQGMLMNMAGMQGGGDLMRIAVEHDPTLAAQMPTDITKMGIQGGMSSADIQAANAAGVAKANYIAPLNSRPGAIVRDPRTMQPMAFNPNIPEGGTPVFDASGNVVGVNSLPGVAGVVGDVARAKASGPASFNLQPVWNPKSGQMELQPATNVASAANAPLPMRNNNPGAVSPNGQVASYPDMATGLQKMDGNLAGYANDPKASTIGGAITKWVGSPAHAPAYISDVTSRLGLPATTPFDATNPVQRQALSTAIMLHENGSRAVFANRPAQGSPAVTPAAQPQGGAFAAAPPPGFVKGAEAGASNLQDELSKKWTNLSDQSTQAQTTNSYLQNIKGLASQAATGQQSDRINYVNGLLALGGSEKATNAVTANNLLDKYSNQIVARLGQGGLGTDSARAILQSAYPNAHMTTDAINEAADNLVGANQMVQAKARILKPLANNRDTTGYNNAEMQFDQNADPRIFQYAGTTDPTARAAFAKKLNQQDPTIANKIKVLHGMGAF